MDKQVINEVLAGCTSTRDGLRRAIEAGSERVGNAVYGSHRGYADSVLFLYDLVVCPRDKFVRELDLIRMDVAELIADLRTRTDVSGYVVARLEVLQLLKVYLDGLVA